MFNKKSISKLSRKNLLEILVLQSKRIDELQEELNKTKNALEDKKIMIGEAGSIAEASLRLNKIFEVAQQTADQYLDNVMIIGDEVKK